MARLFATLVVLYLGGAAAASVAGDTAWPLVCVGVALYYLAKVFAACDAAPPPAPRGPR